MTIDPTAGTAARQGSIAAPDRKTLRRVAFASSIGTTVEYYDFFIYGTAAALVFPIVFFPALGGTASIVASFATFAVAFVARPVGGMLFGYYGDRLGRKKTLVSTLMLMGVSTLLIGLVPGTATIGVAAPIILVLLRFCQGFAVGGEWAGATLLAAEYAPPGRRGLFAIFPQLGPSFAFILSCVTFLITGAFLGDTSQLFLDYGWRVPFLFSAVLILVGLYVRGNLEETPVFAATRDAAVRQGASVAAKREEFPFVAAWKEQKAEILWASGALATTFSFFYMGTAYLISYGTRVLEFSRPFVLSVGIIGAVAMALATAFSGLYSDRVGRRKFVMASCALAIVWALVLFPILDTGSKLAFGSGVAATLLIMGIAYGPTGALLPELFATRHRYTGAGLAYNLAAILGGAIPPLVAAPLTEAFGSIAIGVMLCALAVLSLVCTINLSESKNRTM